MLVSGDRLILDRGLFAIIETCSGLRSIETLALLAILMIDLFGRRGRHALILLVLSPFVAFLINGLRCLGLIFNPHADIASIHNLQGIAMLLGGVLLLYFVDGLLARFGSEPDPISALEQRSRRTATRAPSRTADRGVLVGFSALLVAISLAAAIRRARDRRERSDQRRRAHVSTAGRASIRRPTGCSSGRPASVGS